MRGNTLCLGGHVFVTVNGGSGVVIVVVVHIALFVIGDFLF